MNSQHKQDLFQNRIDEELADIQGNSQLADKILTICGDRKKHLVHVALSGWAVAAAVILALFVLHNIHAPKEDRISASIPLMQPESGIGENDMANSNEGIPALRSQFCPVCNKITTWIMDCDEDHSYTGNDLWPSLEEKLEGVTFNASKLVCADCGNIYILNEYHPHMTEDNGTTQLICPYLEKNPYRFADQDSEIIEKALSAVNDANKANIPNKVEKHCEQYGKTTVWADACLGEFASYTGNVKHVAAHSSCNISIIYEKTYQVCLTCGATEDTGKTHLHLISHNVDAEYLSTSFLKQAGLSESQIKVEHQKYTCPYVKYWKKHAKSWPAALQSIIE